MSKDSTLERQWAMLQLIPRYPSQITANQLTDKLKDRGYEINKRSVERDLLMFEELFGLQVRDDSRPYGWSWPRDAAIWSLPAMNDEQALSLYMLERHTDGWGTFIYLRDRDSGRYWSAAYQPTLRRADHHEAIFVQGRAEFRRRDQSIEAHTEISVSPEDDVEIRRVTLTNQSPRIRHIEVTSYAEVVLAPLNADLAHRAFSNLFVQTEILPERQAILCTRRPRTPGEQVPWMFHLLAAPGAVNGAPSYETDRARFIGRGRTAANPLALESDSSRNLSNTNMAKTTP